MRLLIYYDFNKNIIYLPRKKPYCSSRTCKDMASFYRAHVSVFEVMSTKRTWLRIACYK